eukprot:CCRYP_015216-RA/>CCRYP_015216-RA protein AED:0.01 eAED:0.01 QI:389/1/1/1/1/1/2/1037/1171
MKIIDKQPNHDGIPDVIQRALGTNYIIKTEQQQQQQQQQQPTSPQSQQDGTIRGLQGFLLPSYLSIRCGGSQELPQALYRAHCRERDLRPKNAGGRSRKAQTRKRGSRGNSSKTEDGGQLTLAVSGSESGGNVVCSSNHCVETAAITDRRPPSTVRRRKRKQCKRSFNQTEDEKTMNDKEWFHYQMMARIVVAPYTPYLIETINVLSSENRSHRSEHSKKKSKVSTDSVEDIVATAAMKAAATAKTSTASVTTSKVRNVYMKSNTAHHPKSTNNAIMLSSPRESLESLVDGVVCTLVQRTHSLRNTLTCSSAGPIKCWQGAKSSGSGSTRPIHRRRKRKTNESSTIPNRNTHITAKHTKAKNGTSVNDWLRLKNILSAGYSLGSGETLISYPAPFSSNATAKKSQYNPMLRGCPNMAPGVHCIQPNSVTSYARSSGLMRALHSLVGDEVLGEILLNAVVLIPAVDDEVNYDGCCDRLDCLNGVFERGNYFQLCGPPLNVVSKQFEKIHANATNNLRKKDAAIKQTCAEGTGKPIKRKRDSTYDDVGPSSAARNDHEQKAEWNPNKSIPRYKLFYCEIYARHVGLSPKHVLNQTGSDDSHVAMSGKKRKVSCSTGGALPSATHEIKLLDEMVQLWPKRSQQVNSSTNGGSVVYKNKRRARWRRLRENGVKMCREIIRRHRQCHYARLLEKHCPLLVDKINRCSRKKQNELYSKEELSRLVTLFTPSEDVGKFLEAVLRRAFPSSFWGSKHNFCQVIKTLNVFLNLRLTESFPEKSIVEGIRLLDMKWLHPPSITSHASSGGTKKHKLSRSGHESCFILLRNVMRWIYCQYITPLLRSTFYITDTEFTGRRVVYYRRPIWTRIRSLSLHMLLKRQYRERSLAKAQKVLSTHNVGCPPAPLRLLPKTTGIRAIAMLSKSCSFEDKIGNGTEVETKPTRQSQPSPNAILQSTFHALKYEYKKRPSLFGAGALGVTELCRPYCLFLEALRTKAQRSQFDRTTHDTDALTTTESHEFQLYFTSADIQHCYDNINQDHLYKQVRSVLHEDYYITQNHFIIHSMRGSQSSTRCRWQKTTCSPDKVVDIVSKSNTLKEKFRNSIFVDGVNCSVENRHTILGLLKDHIFGQMLVAKGSLGQRTLHQRNGIPQASRSLLLIFICFAPYKTSMSIFLRLSPLH